MAVTLLEISIGIYLLSLTIYHWGSSLDIIETTYMIQTSLKNSLKALQKNFLWLLLIQLPVGLLVVIQTFLDPYLESSQLLALIILLPLFSCVSSICTALTYLAVRTSESGQKINLNTFKQIDNQMLVRLAASSLVVSVFIGLGLAALVIPGIYFLATYLFVPILVITQPSQKISQYLFDSKTMVTKDKRTLTTTLAAVLASFLMELPIGQLVSFLADFTGGALFLDSFLTMIVGAFFDCFIVFYFLTLKQKESA